MNKFRFCLVLLASLLVSTANATVFQYSLSNKAPGAVAPPDYGLRLDNLFGTGNNTHWTFSFTQTNVLMEIDTVAQTARIFGDVIGGNETGIADEWNSSNGQLWNLDFTYNNINITDASTGFWQADNTSGTDPLAGSGLLTLLDDVNVDGIAGNDGGRSIGLADYSSGTAGWFNIGGPNPKGPYVSSWLADTQYFVDGSFDPTDAQEYNRNGACCKDFGFRAERVPEPTSLLLMGLGLLGLARGRRRS
ncbi:MAG: PEP-CTERM sorting domain-containing protein [Gammaproteobacteria bacterium]|nr:PEP-CTERM sorting domain-containing protein [Gammaproteobacteria bacterium]